MFKINSLNSILLLLSISNMFLNQKQVMGQNVIKRNNNIGKEQVGNVYLPQKIGILKFDEKLIVKINRNSIKQEFNSFDVVPQNVAKVKIIGNKLISDRKIKQLVQSAFNNQIPAKYRVQKIIDKIDRAYYDLGYITSGVIQQPQLKSDGTIVIEITESEIVDIKIAGLNRLNSNYVRDRLFKNNNYTLNASKLSQELHLLKTNHLIDNISAIVIPTPTVGEHILEVEIKEDDHFYLELSLDNLGSPSTGSFRRQLKVNHDNLLGLGDRIYAAYTNAEGRDSLDTLSYTFPINSHNGTVGVGFNVGKLEAIENNLNSLDLDLNFNSFGLDIHQPIYQTPIQELALGINLSRISTETTLFNEPLQIFRGASADGELNISAIDFSQSYLRRGEKDRFDLRSEISLGVNIFDATDNANQPDSSFVIWRGQTSYRRNLTDDINLFLQSYWQLSDRPLVDFEQTPRKLYILDKEESAFILRGYRQGSLSADNGIFASAELATNILNVDSLKSTLRIIPFIDFGTAWNNDSQELAESTLVSLGLGLQLLVNDNFRARVDWGKPLIEQDFDGGSLQEDGVTFNVEYRPF